MKLVNFQKDGQIKLGVLTAKGIMDVAVASDAQGLAAPASMAEVIAVGADGQKKLAALAAKAEQFLPPEQLQFAPPVTNPEKIICVGLNYRSHREECELDIPDFPVLFSKFNNALAAHRQEIVLPSTAVKFDYEAELVIVIGRKAANVSAAVALDYVFGYTAGNDFSARDLQFRTAQWLLGKSGDNFAPLGPCIVTADEIEPQNLEIKCSVNGVIRQAANTKDMIFDCATIISYVSQYFTLQPGDIIFTGTPGGVILGYPEAEQRWLKAGDEVTVTIEKIGNLVNTLI